MKELGKNNNNYTDFLQVFFLLLKGEGGAKMCLISACAVSHFSYDIIF